MWARNEQERQDMITELVIAALPAIAQRHESGISVRRIATVYKCDPRWLRTQMIKARYRVRSLDEPPGLCPAPWPWTPIPMPGQKAMPRGYR